MLRVFLILLVDSLYNKEDVKTDTKGATSRTLSSNNKHPSSTGRETWRGLHNRILIRLRPGRRNWIRSESSLSHFWCWCTHGMFTIQTLPGTDTSPELCPGLVLIHLWFLWWCSITWYVLERTLGPCATRSWCGGGGRWGVCVNIYAITLTLFK